MWNAECLKHRYTDEPYIVITCFKWIRTTFYSQNHGHAVRYWLINVLVGSLGLSDTRSSLSNSRTLRGGCGIEQYHCCKLKPKCSIKLISNEFGRQYTTWNSLKCSSNHSIIIWNLWHDCPTDTGHYSSGTWRFPKLLSWRDKPGVQKCSYTEQPSGIVLWRCASHYWTMHHRLQQNTSLNACIHPIVRPGTISKWRYSLDYMTI